MKLTSTRLLHGIALLSLAGVGSALLSQHVFDMPPCAWCVFQRLLFLVIAAVCWAGVLVHRLVHRSPGTAAPAARVAGGLAALLAVGGMVAAWYQYTVASEMFSCDRTFADRFMVESGLDAGLPWLFGIFATCMDARVELFGMEYALWAMALFAVVGGLGIAAVIRRP